MIIAAEYTTGSKARPATLAITQIADGRRTYIAEHVVSGKAEARKLAAKLGAKPWNF